MSGAPKTTAKSTSTSKPQPTFLDRLSRLPEAVRGAFILIASTAVALAWANLPDDSYQRFWHLSLALELGSFQFELDLRHWVNDALMAVFFAHVTLEVRRELEMGELRDWRRASVPIVAAVAGLVIPALLFVAFTSGTDFVHGWGIVVSTDTAFVLGMLALVGRAMPPQLRIFLVTLAVADDVGALGVIAVVYTDHFAALPLLLAAAGLALIAVMRYFGVWRGVLYLLPAVVVWMGFFLSGVHATLAGVAIALFLPIFPTRAADVRRANEHMRAFQMTPSATYARSAEDSLSRAISVNERVHRALTPYVTWVILPIFALANAGVRITSESLTDAFSSRLTWGIIVGLVVGKTVAITLATWAMSRLRPGSLGTGVRMPHVVGVSMLAGMGFTISLFVTELAFDDPVDVSRAQIGVLAATVAAGMLGAATFVILGRRERQGSANRGRLIRPLDPTRDLVLGDPSRAILQVVEYGNYANPYLPGSAEIRSEMESTFRHTVVYAFRNHPLDEPLGRTTAIAGAAAAEQGRFWEMRDELIREAPIESERQIRRAAASAGLNLRRFERDWAAGSGADRVDEDIADADEMNLERTPTYFIGGQRYEGSIDRNSLNGAVAAALDANTLSGANALVGVGGGGGAGSSRRRPSD
jgi:Na+/H+ antiporter NhaA